MDNGLKRFSLTRFVPALKYLAPVAVGEGPLAQVLRERRSDAKDQKDQRDRYGDPSHARFRCMPLTIN
jgi:hypothetical protein